MNNDQRATANPILAQCKVCRIERCGDCDTVYLHVGHTSLRLTMTAFLSLSATLLEAVHAVMRAEPAPSTARRVTN
ncbi:MAG TPA: hypothetical protein VJ396_04755 [Acidiferrobacterales bacterium]|nr:hypothetical protein [Acidiferrobacterales bacterium]